MSFHEVDFPLALDYSSSSGSGYQSQVIQTASGKLHVSATWADLLHTYDAAESVRDAASMKTLKDFFIARGGSLHGFRFKDPADFTTGAENRGAPGAANVLLGFGDGTNREFQALKRYNPGTPYEWARTIRKLVSGTVRVSVAGVETSAFTIDTATGKILLSVAPADAAAVRAGFEFRVPVRFGPEADRLLSVNFAAFNDERVRVPVIEDRGDAQIPAGYLFGDSRAVGSPAVDQYVQLGAARLWEIVGSPVGGAGWRLPDAAGLPMGGPLFALANQTTGSIPVRDVLGTVLTQVPALTINQVYLGISPAGAKAWRFTR